jgi:archaellum biogenesis protein FlaJ (TadC family)
MSEDNYITEERLKEEKEYIWAELKSIEAKLDEMYQEMLKRLPSWAVYFISILSATAGALFGALVTLIIFIFSKGA